MMEKEFFDKQIKETIAKVHGTLNLLKNGKFVIVRDKLVGISQKLEYILKRINEKEDINKKITTQENNETNNQQSP